MNLKMLLLLTRPRYDAPTHYLFYWAGLLIDEAKKKGVSIIDLDREKASKDNLHSYLSKQPIDTVILNGHGNSVAVAGQDNEIILAVGDGTNFLKDKNIFVRACDAGATLGKEIMKMGAKGFIGYIQPFIFLHDPDSFNRPLEDKLASPVLECSNQVGLSLVKGRSIIQAQEDSLAKYVEMIDRYSTSEATDSFLLPILLWNMNNQVCYEQ